MFARKGNAQKSIRTLLASGIIKIRKAGMDKE